MEVLFAHMLPSAVEKGQRLQEQPVLPCRKKKWKCRIEGCSGQWRAPVSSTVAT